MNMLEKICDEKRQIIFRDKKIRSLSVLEALIKSASPVRGLEKNLRDRARRNGHAIIAEIKKASPSAGILREDYTANLIANEYEESGAACLSVLTEENHFLGKSDDLIAARQACSLPVLRKDFILDVWQIAESRALGADCILIIMAAVDFACAAELHAAAYHYGMDVLVETHDEKELTDALRLPHAMIGINNRNLKTLKTDLATTEELARLVPSDRLLVSESGMRTREDIQRLTKAGARAFLIGESLLRQPHPGNALRALV